MFTGTRFNKSNSKSNSNPNIAQPVLTKRRINTPALGQSSYKQSNPKPTLILKSTPPPKSTPPLESMPPPESTPFLESTPPLRSTPFPKSILPPKFTPSPKSTPPIPTGASSVIQPVTNETARS